MMARASRPLVLVGARASDVAATTAVRAMLSATGFPVVETIRATGVVPPELDAQYLGRIGVHEPAAAALAEADVVLAVGLDGVEHDPKTLSTSARIIHLDDESLRVAGYEPELQVRGAVASAVEAVHAALSPRAVNEPWMTRVASLRGWGDGLDHSAWAGAARQGTVPLAALVMLMRSILDDDDTLICGAGSHDLVVARHFRVQQPGLLLWSGLPPASPTRQPRAIAVGLARPGTHIVSLSGDGRSPVSVHELEAAGRLRLPLTHIVLREENLTPARRGPLVDHDIEHYAASLGARGRRVDSLDNFESALRDSLGSTAVSIIEVSMDSGTAE